MNDIEQMPYNLAQNEFQKYLGVNVKVGIGKDSVNDNEVINFYVGQILQTYGTTRESLPTDIRFESKTGEIFNFSIYQVKNIVIL